MIKDLINIANMLDKKGLTKEADSVDLILRKFSGELIDFPVGRSEDSGSRLRGPKESPLGPGFSGEAEVVDFDKPAKVDYHSDDFTPDPLDPEFVIILDDGETWATDASVAVISNEDLKKLEDNDIRDVVDMRKAINIWDPDFDLREKILQKDNSKWLF